jgi:nucleotide-binding universal stress UspA family protein
MLRLKKILVPVDFSERSGAAAKRAVLLAARFDAQLIFAHVIDRFPYEGTEVEIFYQEDGQVISGKDLDASCRRKLHEFTAGVTDTAPQEILLKGDPAKEIVQFVQDQGVNLVLVPTRGHGPFRQFLLGSVTAKILHDVDCPVLTGTHKEGRPPETPAPYRRIGCALDLSEQSEALLQWADEFAQPLGATLVAIHAAPLVQVIFDDVHLVTADWRDMVVRAAEEKIKTLTKNLRCKVEICVGNGDPIHFVTSAATEQKLDALVIGRGMAKHRASRLPTNAYGIIRESPCPVVSLP